MAKMTIGKKLNLSFAAMLVLIFGLGGFALMSIRELHAALDETAHRVSRRIELMTDLQNAASSMRIHQRGVVMYTLMQRPDRLAQSIESFRSEYEHAQAILREFRPFIATETGRKSADAIEADLAEWRKEYEDLEQKCRLQQLDERLTTSLDRLVALGQQIHDSTMKVLDVQRSFMASAAAAGDVAATRDISIAVLVLCVALGIGGCTFFGVRHTSGTLQRAAAELSRDAAQISGAAGQISVSAQALAQGASEQAASIEETSASSEEITAMTHKNADDSNEAAKLSMETSEIVREANQTLDQMEASMREINASSDKIGKIIKVIDEIAFQTNILALNAAVEAARAGEAGMGFAVVADEVRNLAHRSAQAAKDTAVLIEESISRSAEGRTKLDEVSRTIHAITEKAEKVKTLVDAVHTSSAEQARGIEQIAKAVSQMEQVTQNAAASAEQAAAAGQELTGQATSLNRVVGKLEEMVGRS